jgi:L-asparaginase
VETRVDLFTMCAGFDPRLLHYALDSGARGLVIEGTGRGNAPPAILPAIDRARQSDIPVVLATRCWHGRVLDTYGYEGSGKDLRRRGVIFAGTTNGQKARIHLMLALGKTRSVPEIRRMMEQDLY